MEVKRPKEWESFPELREVKNTQEPKEQKEGFSMMKGKKGYTIADIEALPEGERAELIDGELFRMAAPKRLHQGILMAIIWEIRAYIMNHKGNCKTYPAPFAVRIKKDNRNYVEPDISVICDKDKLDEKGCHGAPDWIIEIVSPSSKKMDYERKVKLYREAGAKEYWIVDPETETVTVYDFENHENTNDENARDNGHDGERVNNKHDVNKQAANTAYDAAPVRYSFSERIKVGIFEDLWLCFAEMDFG